MGGRARGWAARAEQRCEGNGLGFQGGRESLLGLPRLARPLSSVRAEPGGLWSQWVQMMAEG